MAHTPRLLPTLQIMSKKACLWAITTSFLYLKKFGTFPTTFVYTFSAPMNYIYKTDFFCKIIFTTSTMEFSAMVVPYQKIEGLEIY